MAGLRGPTDVRGRRNRYKEIPKADAQKSEQPRATKAWANVRCPTNRTSAFDPIPPVALAQSRRSLANEETLSRRGPRREAANESVLAKVGFAPQIERAS